MYTMYLSGANTTKRDKFPIKYISINTIVHPKRVNFWLPTGDAVSVLAQDEKKWADFMYNLYTDTAETIADIDYYIKEYGLIHHKVAKEKVNQVLNNPLDHLLITTFIIKEGATTSWSNVPMAETTFNMIYKGVRRAFKMYNDLEAFNGQSRGVGFVHIVPTPADVISSGITDYIGTRDGYEEFCNLFGYDRDNNKSKATYKNSLDFANRVATMLGDDFKVFRKALENY